MLKYVNTMYVGQIMLYIWVNTCRKGTINVSKIVQQFWCNTILVQNMDYIISNIGLNISRERTRKNMHEFKSYQDLNSPIFANISQH